PVGPAEAREALIAGEVIPLGASRLAEASERVVLGAPDELEEAPVRLYQGELVQVSGDVTAGLGRRDLRVQAAERELAVDVDVQRLAAQRIAGGEPARLEVTFREL